VNGKPIAFEDESLTDLLDKLSLSKQPCAVEVNNELVPHAKRKDFTLQDGDTIEIVTLVGGG